MSDTYETLLAGAITGDADALSALLEQHTAELRAAIQIDQKWAAAFDPDDVLQVTFLEAFLRIGQFRPAGPGAFAGWLRQIARNNLRDAVKELSREKRPPPEQRLFAAPHDESATQLLVNLGVTTTTPSRRASEQEVRTILERALSLLPPDYAAVVRMYDLDGKSIGEVASAVGRSAGAVHMLRSRAHDYLREVLGSETQFFSTPGHPA